MFQCLESSYYPNEMFQSQKVITQSFKTKRIFTREEADI